MIVKSLLNPKAGAVMEVKTLTDTQFTNYLALVNAEILIPGATTGAADDYPVVFDQRNRPQILGICEGDTVKSGVSYLVRQFHTSCGPVPVACIGSVVTDPEFRGQGLSRVIQEEIFRRLDAADVPLAALWTDTPDIYRGRGFSPAGWEFHVGLDSLEEALDFPAGFSCRPFSRDDGHAVASLYERHPMRTQRLPGDAESLYTMPGTQGLVATGSGNQVVAAVFCGKGSDFQDYVTEWSGPLGLVMPLLDEARKRRWARHVLVPSGGEQLAVQLAARGAVATAHNAGHWAVVQPTKLSLYLQGAGVGSPGDPANPQAILGHVGDDGVVVPGALTVAVWGFDSI